MAIDTTNGGITPSASVGTVGPHIVTFVTTLPSCPASDTAHIYLDIPDTADIYFGGDPNVTLPAFCSNDVSTSAQPGPGFTPGGLYTLAVLGIPGNTPAAMVPGTNIVRFNDTEGQISVTYTTPNNSTCGSATDIASFVVNGAPDPVFNYLNPFYCKDDSIFTPQSPYVSNVGTFSASPPGLVFTDPMTGSIDPAASAPGIYTVTHKVWVGNDTNACRSSHQDILEIKAVDASTYIVSDTTTYCVNDEIHISVLGNLNPTGNWSVLTAGLNISAQSPDSAIFGYSGVVDDTFQIRYSGYGYCDEADTVTVFTRIRRATTLDYDDHSDLPNHQYCNNDPLILAPVHNNLGGLYSIDPPANTAFDSLTGQLSLDSLAPSQYLITFKPDSFCLLDAQLPIRVWEAPNPEAATFNIDPTSICEGQPVKVYLTSAFFTTSLLASNPTDTCTDPICSYPFLNDGEEIHVQFTDIRGCSIDSVKTVSVHPYPAIQLDPSGQEVLVAAGQLRLAMRSSAQQTVFHWEAYEGAHWLNADSAGLDSIQMVTDSVVLHLPTKIDRSTPVFDVQIAVSAEAYGCPALPDTVHFIVIPNNAPPIFIPGAFTPDGDNVNDLWQIEFPENEGLELYYIEVFNRSGGMVKTVALNAPKWDGGNLPEGVYQYILRSPAGEFVKHGGVTIKR